MSVPLTFLFECHLKDGTVLHQTLEDVSTTDPTRSAFYDVMQRMDEVAFFGLYSIENPQITYVVDLRDGHFEVNGTSFRAGDPQSLEFPEDTIFRLVYYRQHTVQFDIGLDEIGHRVQYHLGWQTTVDEKNYQQVIAVV